MPVGPEIDQYKGNEEMLEERKAAKGSTSSQFMAKPEGAEE